MYTPNNIPENEEYGSAEKSGWYSANRDFTPPSAGEDAPQNTESPLRSPYKPKAPRKSRFTLKVVTLTLCVVILVFAAAVAFGGSETDGPLPDSSAGGKLPGGFDSFEDYGDFLDNYYTDGDEEPDIPKAATGTGVTLEISQANRPQLTLKEIYARCSPWVVSITARKDGIDYSWGTGIVFTADGYIITNSHIIEGTDSAVITLYDDSEYDASLVGYDTASDLAVLKIDAEGLPCAEFGPSADLQVGDGVVAIGNPLGKDFRGTMTDGIVSAINRNVTYNSHSMTLIQTNAAINEGNSGGPLLNMRGQVVGITNMKMMSSYTSIEGIGFAIPSSTIKSIADQLLRQGYVSGRPTIGITAGGIPSDAALFYELPDGVYVSEVIKASDAWKKGLREGDIITAVNDIPVTSVTEINAIKEPLSVGDTLVLTVYREGETFVVDVLLMDSKLLQD